MAGDEELNELLDELDRQTASEDPDRAVERARESLEETLAGLKLTPEEETALADELRQLRDLTQKLDETTIEIAAFGMVSRGKSSVLNALVGQEVFKVGATHGTTVARAAQRWEQSTARPARARRGPAGRRRYARDRRGRRRGPRSAGPRRRPACRPDPLHRLRRHAARRDRGPGRAARGPEADHPRLQPDRPLSRARPRTDLRQDQGRAGQEPRPARRRRDDRGPARCVQGQDPAPRRHDAGPVGAARAADRAAQGPHPRRARPRRQGPGRPEHAAHRRRPARRDRRAEGPDPRRGGQPPDLELRAGQGRGRRAQPDPRRRHGRRPGRGRRHDRHAEQALRHPADRAAPPPAWSAT